MTDRDIYDDNGNRYPAQKGEIKVRCVQCGGRLTEWHYPNSNSMGHDDDRYVIRPCSWCGGKGFTEERAKDPTPRQRLAEAIQAAVRREALGQYQHIDRVWLSLPEARTILAALQEADRRAMQATIDGDMPCS